MVSRAASSVPSIAFKLPGSEYIMAKFARSRAKLLDRSNLST